MDPTIKSVQAEARSKARRNLKRGRSLKEENDDAKRVARNEEQVTVVDEVAAQDRIALPQARAGKSRMSSC
jgi:Flp pilus assembly protein TadD